MSWTHRTRVCSLFLLRIILSLVERLQTEKLNASSSGLPRAVLFFGVKSNRSRQQGHGMPCPYKLVSYATAELKLL